MTSRPRILELALLLGFCLFLFFYGLAAFGLVGVDEPRYAQVAREMLARHDWVTPVLYGQPWLEKPILYYWQAMLAYKIFGVSDWAARLPSALLATLLVFAVYLFCRRVRRAPDGRLFASGGAGRGVQLDAALMTASSALVLGMARAASTDMSLAAPFTVSMLCWYAWYESVAWAQPRRWFLLGFHAALGLATLAKGPVAPGLAALIIVAFCLTMRQPRLIAQTLWIPGLVCFLAVTLPWYVEVQLQTPQFLRVFILEHNLARFGTNIFRHKQPFWYYVPVILLATAPWTLFAVLGVIDAVKQRPWLSFRAANKQPENTAAAAGGVKSPLSLFLLLWGVIPVVFFSLSQSKLAGYILPSVPALTILAALAAHDRMRTGRRVAWVVVLHAAICAAVIAGVLLAPTLVLKLRPAPRAIGFSLAAGAFTLLVVGGMLFARGLRMLRPLTLLPVVIGVAFLLRVAAPSIDAAQSARPAARFLREVGVGPDDRLASFSVRREVAYGLAFYRNRPPEVYEGWPLLDANEFPSSGTPPPGSFYVLTRGDLRPELQRIMPERRLRPVGFYGPQHFEVLAVGPK